MHLSKLSLINFKNYTEAEFEFGSSLVCLTGNNGEGKTNVLDAIHYLSLCKSYFNPIDSHNIKYNEQLFMVQGSFNNGKHEDLIHCGVKKGQKKSFKKNKKDYKRLADHVGLYPVVMITPYDTDLIIEGSEIRRKLLDSIISQYDRKYLDELIAYNKALSQRNALLKQFAENGSFSQESIEIWDAQLTEHGRYIYNCRAAFFEQFIPLFQQQYNTISGGVEEAHIAYKSHLAGAGLDELLKQSIDRDQRVQYTTKGVHKDDLEFEINGHPVKRYASQGQQKSFLIALKLAQYHFISRKKEMNPILLLDDIFDKLDSDRVKHLLDQVSGENFGQVFITDTHPSRVHDMLLPIGADHQVFKIKAGNIVEQEGIEPAVA